MSLTDAVAAQVLGEVHALAKRIDDLASSLEHTAARTEASAHTLIERTRQVLNEAEGAAKALHQDNTLPIINQLHSKLKDQINALNHTAGAVTLTGEVIKKDMRQSISDARDAARVVIDQSKYEATMALRDQVAEVMGSAVNKNKATTIAIGGGVAAVIVLIAGLAGYVVGNNAGKASGYAKARDETAATAWANTADGKVAYSLVQSGMLSSLTRCNSRGWKAEGDVFCSPYRDNSADKPTFFAWRAK